MNTTNSDSDIIIIEDSQENSEEQGPPVSNSKAANLTQVPVHSLGATVVRDKTSEGLQGQMVPSSLPPTTTAPSIATNSSPSTTAAATAKPRPKPVSSKPRTKPSAVTKSRTKPKSAVVSFEHTKTLSSGVTPSQIETATARELSSTEKKGSIKKRVLSAGISPTSTSHSVSPGTLLTTPTTKRIPNIAEELAKNRTDPKFLLHSFSEQRSTDVKHAAVDPTVVPTVPIAVKQATPLLSSTSHSKPTDSKSITKKARVKVSKPKSTSNKTTSGTPSTPKGVSATLGAPKVEVSAARVIEPKTVRPLLGAQNMVSTLSSPADNNNDSNSATTQNADATKSSSPLSLPITKRLPGLKKSKSTISSPQNSTPKRQTSGGSGATQTSKVVGPQKAKRIKSTGALPTQGQQQQQQKQKQPVAPAAQPGSNVPSNANTGNTLKRPPPINPPTKLTTTLQEMQEAKLEPHHARGSPVMVFDIPLYSTESNEYLDENGTVTFNLLDLIDKSKVPLSGAEGKRIGTDDLKLAKRNRLFDEALVEDNNDEGDVEDGKTKKRPHPMKGKSLIGKYDIDDPFIDDSELLWEEQRALAEDGFFVFFGPLVASSESLSPEAGSRSGGTGHHGGTVRKGAGNSRK